MVFTNSLYDSGLWGERQEAYRVPTHSRWWPTDCSLALRLTTFSFVTT